ncbi:hypothetical protein ACFOTA_13225 [Chitinophaga sp. GCM10012297]|uniref:Bacteriocin-like protein n=1 Tax=Chitinophaga chungangae TaxID=2821488 RepID=A0ABS3YFE3_9BACT|nr:hypothetical protein [Chitinophaga chungangae]MBO9153175.1 hypothetical protein [Chitinophaga chungangae]
MNKLNDCREGRHPYFAGMLPTILTELSVTDMRNIAGGKSGQHDEAGENGLPALPPVKFGETPDLAKAMTAPVEEEEKEKQKGR